MTPAEKRQERAAVALEYEGVRQKLELLRSRAFAISHDVAEIACWLSGARDIPQGPAISRRRVRDEKIEKDVTRCRTVLNLDAIVARREEMKNLRKRLNELAAQKEELWW